MTALTASRFRRRNPITLRRIAVYAGLLMLASYALLPSYWILISAVRPLSELLALHPAWIPAGFDLSRFVDIWTAIPLGHYMLNGALVALVTVVVAVTTAGLAGYALSRFEFPGNSFVMGLVLFTQTIPTVVLLVPLYNLLDQWNLLNTPVALPISYTVWSVPYATLILRGYFKSAFSREVEEAARIDGCSRVGILWRIVLPLSLPGLFSAGMLVGVVAWNEFLWASLVASSEPVRTVAVGLNQFVGRFGTNENLPLWMAGAVFVSLPPIILYLAAQRFVAVGYGVTDR